MDFNTGPSVQDEAGETGGGREKDGGGGGEGRDGERGGRDTGGVRETPRE